jgi:S1-C subfamily serine protease
MLYLNRACYRSTVSIKVLNDVNKNSVRCGSGFICIYQGRHYVITNKHILGSGSRYAILFYNSNPKNRRFIKISPKNQELYKIIRHPMQKIDVAVIYISRTLLASIDFEAIPISQTGLSLDEMYRRSIYEGAPVLALGHPYDVTKHQQYHPIVRHGVIAKITDVYDLKPKYKTFWLDMFTYPGNSGGPVYVNMSQNEMESSKLIGIISASLMVNGENISPANIGITQVIACDHIFECILYEEV